MPDYACAIIHVGSDGFLLEARGSDARFAAGSLTCFGGRRHDGESAEACLLRELQEELQWQPDAFKKVCELHVNKRYIADFFSCTLNSTIEELRFEPDRSGVVLKQDELADSNLSPWHKAVFNAVSTGKSTVYLSK